MRLTRPPSFSGLRPLLQEWLWGDSGAGAVGVGLGRAGRAGCLWSIGWLWQGPLCAGTGRDRRQGAEAAAEARVTLVPCVPATALSALCALISSSTSLRCG